MAEDQGQLSFNPFAIDSKEKPTLEETRAFEINASQDFSNKIARMHAVGPSVRQQTQSEILNLALLYRELGGNPFSVRRIPFSVLRDMTTDPMIAYALYYIINPLVQADWVVKCEDAQLAAAVDAAFRPINANLVMNFANSLSMGYSPLIKQWKLGQLKGKYRDKNSSAPEEDREIWDSPNVDVLLPEKPLALAPENVLPRWDEFGNFDGYMYSPVPIPNPQMIGIANVYGPTILSGFPIPLEHALWIVNEQEQNYGSIYGSPRTKRAYRYFWSYWYRWALADRSYEKKADPTIIVRYPTATPEGFDSNDPNPEKPTLKSLEEQAIKTGMNVRSGSVIAMPGDFETDVEGKSTGQRKWDIEYLEGGENFEALDKTFALIDALKLRSMFLPEQAFLDSNVTGQGSSQRYVATQMGEIYQESQQYLIDTYDDYKNLFMLPQFIAKNFPAKVDIPCEIVTGGLGVKNNELVKQLFTIIGQKDPSLIPVDLRALLRQEGMPILGKAEQDAQMKAAAERAAKAQPPLTPPTKSNGTQGYNAGVENTNTGEHIYVTPPGQINLSSHMDFLSNLPNIPPYKDPASRSASLQLRKLFIDRYKNQIKSFANDIRNKKFLQLAEKKGLNENKFSKGHAQVVAESAIAAWLLSQANDLAPTQIRAQEILMKVIKASGKKELHLAHLDTAVFSPDAIEPWVKNYSKQSLEQMDHTLREEFIDFLTDQLQTNNEADHVATAFEEHFDETPLTHADRAVRLQAGEAYNEGVIGAAIDAGIAQVMAHDASDGTDTNTDLACQKRNGKVFTPQQAKLEKKLHPNCTLYWTYLNTDNLSLEVVDSFPDELNLAEDQVVLYNENTETLMIRKDAQDKSADWMLEIGRQLQLR